MKFETLIEILKEKGIAFEKGLDLQEYGKIEALYGIKFPPDLKEFLTIGLPVSKGFVNWRDMSEANIESIRERLNWPLDGVIFDVENNVFWYSKWGCKPKKIEDAIEICKYEIKKVPKLIPIFSHRYIPSQPHESCNPVFSVYQTDIIYYGENLTDYLKREFNVADYRDVDSKAIKEIRFWSEIM